MDTTRERWFRIQQLCESLETVPAEARARHLEAAESDPVVRQDVLELLKSVEEEAEWSLRERSKFEGERSKPEVLDSSIGPYRIVESLGAGGSGEVFRAVRTVNGIEHFVALKRFHPQRSGPEQLERFRREQQMLAALTHPDIVHFIDAGLSGDGRPYLVMDLAEGEPITANCDRLRLKLSERLTLMRQVCDAVQAAHERLIVHLDLKPSNIFVAGGRVKLLDFGTAKLVDPKADVTRTVSLTLLYASPEQVRGEPVSVACDVYSLGLILYELVSGSWPFKRPETMMSVAERAAGLQDPRPLPAHISRDLDAICRKAIAHDPAARYRSVAELVEDLRRFRAGDPVRARGIGMGYRLRMFTRRHAWKVAGAVILVAGLSAAAIYSAAQARSARQAASRSEAANEFLTGLLTLTGRDSASRTSMSVRELLTLAEQRVAPMFGRSPDDQVVATEIETALATGLVMQDALPEARALFVRAIDRAKSLSDIPREAIARAGFGYVRYLESDTDAAWAESKAALDLWSRHRSRFTTAQAATLLDRAAATLSYVRPTDLASREYYEACVAMSPARPPCLLGLATSYALVDARYADAEPLLQRAIAIQRADPTATAALTNSLQMYGMVSRYLGRFNDDERAQREAYEISARIGGADSMVVAWQRAVWALSLVGVGRGEDAHRESLAVMMLARRHVPTRGGYLLWTPLFTAAATACVTGRFDECESNAREAIDTLGKTPSADPRFAAARGLLGVSLVHRGRCTEGKPMVEEAIQASEARRRASPYARLLADAAACAAR